QGRLVAAGGAELLFTVPQAAASLSIVATLSDGLGNVRSASRSVEVLPALAVTAASETRPFQTAVADVGEAFFGVGREVHGLGPAGATRRARLDGTITSIAPVGGRLLCALDTVGLELIDPAAGYAVVATLPLSGSPSALAATERFAIVQIGTKLISIVIS